WGTGNVFLVYRAIGSVQLPRRLGDLEIVEAVPQRVLLGGTLTTGLVFGFLLALGTGDWWMAARPASHAPRFGVADPLLQRDLGFYVGQLPWLERMQGLFLRASVTGTILVALLYLGMGSLRFRRWLPQTSAHARGHLGLLLAATALALAWGAVLDPAETVAGLALPLWDAGRVGAATARRAPQLLGPHSQVAGIGLSVHGHDGSRASWLVAQMPDLEALAHVQPAPQWTDLHRGSWAHAGRPVVAVEADSGLRFASLATRDSAAWFGPGFREFAVVAAARWPAPLPDTRGRLARSNVGARPGPARAAERESPGSAPVAATVSAPGVPDCGRARDAGAHRLGRLAAAPARPVRGGRARHGSGSGDARLD